jgi:hypothetical protein
MKWHWPWGSFYHCFNELLHNSMPWLIRKVIHSCIQQQICWGAIMTTDLIYCIFWKVIGDHYWLLRYVHHLHFKNNLKALAARSFIWRPSKERRPLVFFHCSFINLEKLTIFELLGSIFERPPNPEFWSERHFLLNVRSWYTKELIYVKKQPKICLETFCLARGYNNPPPPWLW